MTDPRPSKTGQQLLDLMRAHDIAPSLQMMPGSTIQLPGKHQAEWEAAHAGKPVLSSVVAALVVRGWLRGWTDTVNRVRWWTLATPQKEDGTQCQDQ